MNAALCALSWRRARRTSFASNALRSLSRSRCHEHAIPTSLLKSHNDPACRGEKRKSRGGAHGNHVGDLALFTVAAIAQYERIETRATLCEPAMSGDRTSAGWSLPGAPYGESGRSKTSTHCSSFAGSSTQLATYSLLLVAAEVAKKP